MLYPRVYLSVVTAAIIGLSMMASPVFSASQCKGLSEDSCLSDNSCRWVNGYVRKDGREVSSHCRLGRANKQAAKADPVAAARVSATD